jgi:DNA sulfur modification protein DndC
VSRTLSLFGEAARLQMTDAIRMSAEELDRYAESHDHWILTWSGGKDSTTVVTFVLACIARKMIRAPKRITVLYADTRMEPLPLWLVAADIRDELLERGVDVRVVMAPVDERFLVYMLAPG